MNNPKNDNYYIEKILTDLKFISKYMSDVSKDEFEQNEILLDSMLFRLIQVSENTRKLSDEYKFNRADIPWRDIAGLRNRVVHDYGSVDLKIVYSTLVDDVPELIELFETEFIAK